MAKYSGFNSNFVTTSGGIGSGFSDILSTTVEVTNVVVGGTTKTLNWRYFYLADMLIQFTSGVPQQNVSNGSSYTINYPVGYNTQPWLVLVTPTNFNSGQQCFITLTSINNNNCVVYLPSSYADGFFTCLVIGRNPNLI